MTAAGTFTYVEHGWRDSAGRVVAVAHHPRAEEIARSLAEQHGGIYVRHTITITRDPWRPA